MSAKVWSTGLSGSWATNGNWSPSGSPGVADAVSIGGPAYAYQVITGPGAASSMVFTGNTTLSGNFTAGSFSLGTASVQGGLSLAAGTLLSATSGTVLFGPLQVGGSGARLVVSGTLTLGGSRSVASLFPDTVAATLGGVVQAGTVVLSPSPGGNGISVDAVSSFEVGTAGGAAVGRITVDPGRSVSGAGTLSAPGGVVNQGTITAQGGTLAISGSVTGAGQLQIGAGGTLYVYNGVSTESVLFTASTGTLEVTTSGAGLTETGVISGFAPGHIIQFASSTALTSAVYQAGAANLGTLTLKAGAATVGTLTLAGNYSGYSFQVAPNTAYGTNVSAVLTGAAVGGGNALTSPTDAFGWIGGSGAWSAAANWQDTTTGTAAQAVPGAGNAVTLNGSAGTAVLTVAGPGTSASLLVLGNNALSGAFGTGALAVGSSVAAGALTLGADGVLSARSATVLYGGIKAAGAGAKLTVSGALTLGGTRANPAAATANTLALTGGAAAQAASLVLSPSTGGNNIAVDAASVLEIGTAGGATPGRITVDPGAVLSGAGVLTAAAGVMDAGTILAQGGMLEIGTSVTGGGQLQIGAGATLYLHDGVSTSKVAFTGAGGTLRLTLAPGGGLTQAGTISGFAPGDVIGFASGSAVTGVTYQQGSNGAGTLSLMNGAATVGTMSLAGSYYGYAFALSPHLTYGYDITVTARFAASPDPLFDAEYYLAHNPDVYAAGIDPYFHYMTYGWKEGRDPSSLFHEAYYLNQNPDVAAAGINPLTHFETSGWLEGRDPSLGFSVRGYLAANPDVKASGADPLMQYITTGQAEGRPPVAATPRAVGTPDPGVDYAWYYAQHPELAVEGIDASAHYHAAGVRLGYNPDPFFDTNFYLTQNPDVRAAGVDPLLHYEMNGWREGRAPSLLFSGASYLAANPDVKAAGVDPLLHYRNNGRAEGRIGFMTGTGATPDPLVDAAYYDAQLGATLIPAGAAGQAQAAASYGGGGWQHGLNPDAFFDTAYYLGRNPDVAAAGINPLLHYESNGWWEGRDPSAQFSNSKYLAAYGDVKAAGMNPLLHFLQFGQAEGRTAFQV